MIKYCSILWVAICVFTGSCVGQQAADNSYLQDRLESRESLLVQDKEIDEPIWFDQYVGADIIGGDMIEHRVASSVTFINCTFNAPVGKKNQDGKITQLTFERNLTFIGCTFKDSVLFSHIKVLGRTDFTKSTFKKEVNFQNAKFEDVVTFSNADFEYETKFQNAFFNRSASYFRAEFIGNSFFKNCFFQYEANFGAATFYEYGDFSLSVFSESTNFDHVKFQGRGTFGSSVFKDLVTFNSCQFGNYAFQNTSFRMGADFISIKIDERLDFKEARTIHGVLNVKPSDEKDLKKISELKE